MLDTNVLAELKKPSEPCKTFIFSLLMLRLLRLDSMNTLKMLMWRDLVCPVANYTKCVLVVPYTKLLVDVSVKCKLSITGWL